ncbi:MAG: aminoacyl-tRNA hydrolase [Chloroflexota bacterium]
MRLIVGLGNPGRRYADSRHNVGFRCVDELARRLSINLTRQSYSAYVGGGFLGSEKVLLAKPQTYMNASGESVWPLLRYYGLSPADLVVVFDDMDLPFGRLRVRERGSAGGHRGMLSIIGSLGTEEFPRVRVGIGRPPGEAKDYVLGRFSPAEAKELAEVVERAADAVETLVREGIAATMNTYNA